MNTKTFTATVNDKNIELMVKTPSLQDQREGQKIYNQAFTDAIKSKSVVRAKLDDLLQEQGLWNDEKQAQFTSLQKELLEGEKKLAKGGFSIQEAKSLALKMRLIREEIRDLISVRTSLDNHSAEGQADNARFNYLVSVCVVYKDSGKPYFNSLEEYLNSSDNPVAMLGAQTLAGMIYGLDNNFEKTLPENKFLHKYKFVDEKLRLIDKQGRLIDAEGRLIDDNGRYIDEQGNYVDKFGNKVDKDGEYVVEQQPFLDENGNPIILESDKPNDKDATTVEPSANKPSEANDSKPVEAAGKDAVSSTT
jgi:hypothetical protein